MSKNELILSSENVIQCLQSNAVTRKPNSAKKSSKQLELFNRYQSASAFMVDYNPDLQSKLINAGITHSDIALNDKIPSLGLLRSTFGDTTPIEWLKIQFGSLNDYAEQGIGISPGQLTELASLYLAEYFYLNTAEVCLFLARFKLGKYGQFYGSIGPMKIMSAMCAYSKERRRALNEHERTMKRKRQQERINNRTGISFDEYVEIKKRADEGDEQAIELLKPPVDRAKPG